MGRRKGSKNQPKEAIATGTLRCEECGVPLLSQGVDGSGDHPIGIHGTWTQAERASSGLGYCETKTPREGIAAGDGRGITRQEGNPWKSRRIPSYITTPNESKRKLP